MFNTLNQEVSDVNGILVSATFLQRGFVQTISLCARSLSFFSLALYGMDMKVKKKCNNSETDPWFPQVVMQ